MAGMVNQLIDIMGEQCNRYTELLGLAQEKKDAIVKNDIEHLQKITHLENMVVSQNQKLERKRIEITQDIANVMGKKVSDLNIDALIDLLEGQAEQEGLKEVGTKIRTTVTELADANELNGSLIQNALDYIEYSLNVIQTSVKQDTTTYAVKGGQLKEESGIFDARN